MAAQAILKNKCERILCVISPPCMLFSPFIQFIFMILFVFSPPMKYQASLLNFHTYFLWWSSLSAPYPHSTAHTPSPASTLASPVLLLIILSTFLP